jgi:hypothetical protein
MSTPHRADPDSEKAKEPATPTIAGPEDKMPFAFVERPHVEAEVYISRPELGRDPVKRDR